MRCMHFFSTYMHLVSPAGPQRAARLQRIEAQTVSLDGQLKAWAAERRATLTSADIAAEQTREREQECFDRRVRLDVGGGFIPAFLWDEAKVNFKNESVQKLYKLLSDPAVWCDLLVYSTVTSINTAVFRWLRPAATLNRLQGERRVPLVAYGVECIGELYSGLSENTEFMQPILTACKPFLDAMKKDDTYVRHRVALLGQRLKDGFAQRSRFFQGPPACLAALAGPWVLNTSLAVELEKDIPGAARIFGNHPLFSDGCVIMSEEDTRQRAQDFIKRYDAGDTSEWRHPTCHLFLKPGGDLRTLVDAYINDPQLTLRTSPELLPLRRKLIEKFVAPPLTTQEIEGVHGIMTGIAREAPNMKVKTLAVQLSGRLNGDLEWPEYKRIVGSTVQADKQRLAEFRQNANRRHRTDRASHTFWHGELQGPKAPEFDPADKQLWLGAASAASADAKDFAKLVVELLPLQTWFGLADGVGRWKEIFRRVRQENEESDMAFQAVDLNNMRLQKTLSFDSSRFVGQRPEGLRHVFYVRLVINAEHVTLSADAATPLLAFRAQHIETVDGKQNLSGMSTRELAWMICCRRSEAETFHECYEDLRRRTKATLTKLWGEVRD